MPCLLPRLCHDMNLLPAQLQCMCVHACNPAHVPAIPIITVPACVCADCLPTCYSCQWCVPASPCCPPMTCHCLLQILYLVSAVMPVHADSYCCVIVYCCAVPPRDHHLPGVCACAMPAHYYLILFCQTDECCCNPSTLHPGTCPARLCLTCMECVPVYPASATCRNAPCAWHANAITHPVITAVYRCAVHDLPLGSCLCETIVPVQDCACSC